MAHRSDLKTIITDLSKLIKVAVNIKPILDKVDELEHLARIGKATVKAFDQGYDLIYNTDILGACDIKEIYSVKDLLKWAESEGK